MIFRMQELKKKIRFSPASRRNYKMMGTLFFNCFYRIRLGTNSVQQLESLVDALFFFFE